MIYYGRKTLELCLRSRGMNFEEIYQRRVDMIYRLCHMYLKNPDDAQDATQSTFEKLLVRKEPFESLEHEKAWLIVCASNLCKNMLKHWYRSKRTDVEEMTLFAAKETPQDETLALLYQLDDESRRLVYLVYYEGYKMTEIAEMDGVNESTLRSRLARARQQLKLVLEEDEE